jgi:phage-related minor tail protein
VRRATEAKREAEDKLRKIKKWCRDYDSQIEPLAKKVENLRHSLLCELPNAVAFLEQAATTLNDYTQMRPKGTATPPTTLEEKTEKGEQV